MGAIRGLVQVKDGNGVSIQGSAPSGGWVDTRVLAANTHEAHTVPTGANYVRVTVTGNTFINIGGTATVVSADITNGNSSVLMVNALPRLFALNGATTIGVIASAIQTAVLEFYS
jgi:hypothetical protein